MSACCVEVGFKRLIFPAHQLWKHWPLLGWQLAILCILCISASPQPLSACWLSVPLQHTWFWTYAGSLFVSGVLKNYTGLMIWHVGINASFKGLPKSCFQPPHLLWLSVESYHVVDASVSWVAELPRYWQSGPIPGVCLRQFVCGWRGWNWLKLSNRLFRKPY